MSREVLERAGDADRPDGPALDPVPPLGKPGTVPPSGAVAPDPVADHAAPPAEAAATALDADLSHAAADGFSGDPASADVRRPRRLSALPVGAAVAVALVAGVLGGHHEAERTAARRAQQDARLVVWPDMDGSGSTAGPAGTTLRVNVRVSSSGGGDLRLTEIDLPVGRATVVAGPPVVKPGEAASVTLELAPPCPPSGAPRPATSTADVVLANGTSLTLPVSLADGGLLVALADQACAGRVDASGVAVVDMRADAGGGLELTATAAGADGPMLFAVRVSAEGASAGWTLDSSVSLPVRLAPGHSARIILRLIPPACTAPDAVRMPGFGMLTPSWRPSAGSSAVTTGFVDGWKDGAVTAAASATLALACRSAG